LTTATSCFDIFSHSLNAAVKSDLPEPAVPMMNAKGMFVVFSCDVSSVLVVKNFSACVIWVCFVFSSSRRRQCVLSTSSTCGLFGMVVFWFLGLVWALYWLWTLHNQCRCRADLSKNGKKGKHQVFRFTAGL
jgi:hypothetical protein